MPYLIDRPIKLLINIPNIHVYVISCGYLFIWSFNYIGTNSVLASIASGSFCGHIFSNYIDVKVSVNIVPGCDIEGRKLASIRRYPNKGQFSLISV